MDTSGVEKKEEISTVAHSDSGPQVRLWAAGTLQVGACGHWSWTLDVPGRGLYVGTQSQVVAGPGTEMVCIQLFVLVFLYPNRKELKVLEAWAPCLCGQDVMLGWGACRGTNSSHFQLSTGGQRGESTRACLLSSPDDESGLLSPVPQPLEANLTSTIKVNETQGVLRLLGYDSLRDCSLLQRRFI